MWMFYQQMIHMKYQVLFGVLKQGQNFRMLADAFFLLWGLMGYYI